VSNHAKMEEIKAPDEGQMPSVLHMYHEAAYVAMKYYLKYTEFTYWFGISAQSLDSDPSDFQVECS